MKTTHLLSLTAILAATMAIRADDTITHELNITGGSGIEPSYNLFCADVFPNFLAEYRTTLWPGIGSASIVMSSNLPETYWVWRVEANDIMQLEVGNGGGAHLSLSHGAAPKIILNAGSGAVGSASITIEGTPVLTQTAADTRYLRTDLTRLQFGTGSLANTSYSIALGERVRANGLGAAALGASHYTTSLVREHFASGQGATSFGFASQSTGEGATAIGNVNTANGDGAIAIGASNSAGAWAFAFGYENVSSGGLALGYYNTVAGGMSFALGRGNSVSADESTAVGSENNITGAWAFAGGFGNATAGDYATALGFGNDAQGWRSFSAGVMASADGEESIAVGIGTAALGNSQMVIGRYNDTTLDGAAAFIVGNGSGPSQKRNALVIGANNDTEAKGNLHSKKTTGYNRFKAPILVAPGGDISMGEFTAGEQP